MTKCPPILVAIVGGSGSGKTWLAQKLQFRFGRRATRLSLDNFYRDRSHLSPTRRAKLNFDHPRAIDWGVFKQAMVNLRAGRVTRIPLYDFSTHCRLKRQSVLRPKPIILVEGLWLLHRADLRRLFAVKIFLDCPARKRLQRRLARDMKSRGRSTLSIKRQFRETVEPMHRRFVSGQASLADMVLSPSVSGKEIAKIAKLLLRKLAV